MPPLAAETERKLKEAYMRGYQDGIHTVSEGTFDIPAAKKFEWFMEEAYSE